MGYFIIKIMWFLIIAFGAYTLYALFVKEKDAPEEVKDEDEWGAF